MILCILFLYCSQNYRDELEFIPAQLRVGLLTFFEKLFFVNKNQQRTFVCKYYIKSLNDKNKPDLKNVKIDGNPLKFVLGENNNSFDFLAQKHYCWWSLLFCDNQVISGKFWNDWKENAVGRYLVSYVVLYLRKFLKILGNSANSEEFLINIVRFLKTSVSLKINADIFRSTSGKKVNIVRVNAHNLSLEVDYTYNGKDFVLELRQTAGFLTLQEKLVLNDFQLRCGIENNNGFLKVIINDQELGIYFVLVN